MKIGIISNLYPPYTRGGAEILASKIAIELRRQGHDVFVITSKKSGNLDVVEESGVRVYRFKPLNIFYYLDDVTHSFFMRYIWRIIDSFSPQSFFVIKKILKKEKPDVVLTHNLTGIGMFGVRAIRMFNITHIHTLHDLQLVQPSGLLYYGEEDKKIFGTLLFQRLMKFYFNQVAAVISPSQFLLSYHNDAGFFKKSYKQVIQNPLSVGLSPKNREGSQQAKDVSLLYIGQIERHKGINFLVNSFKNYKNTNFRLTIIGGGSEEAAIRKSTYGDERITLVGKVDHTQVTKYIKSSQYIIVPSLCYENSPTVIYEAFSQGVPVIASAIGGIPELVKHKKNGFLFEPTSREQLYAIFDYIVDESDKGYGYLSEYARTSIQNNTIENYVKELGHFLKDIK